MIIDLAAQDAGQRCSADIVVIGGGIAGLLLATRMREHGFHVVVLESGGREQTEDTHPLNRVVQLGDPYHGAARGRFRCLGGTSTRWGGSLIPPLDDDLAARPYLDVPPWPIGMDAVRPYLDRVERLFDVDSGSYEEDFVEWIGAGRQVPTGDADFTARFAKWPAFKARNVAVLLNDRIERDPGLQIWIDATVTDFDLDDATGRMRAVTARHERGNAVTVAATQVAICAGAIESTRLLLLLDRQHEGRVFEGCRALGRYLNDHISLPMATVEARQIARLNRMAAFRFLGATMRSMRFELSPSAQKDERVGSAFGHISPATGGATGLDGLRNFLRSLQQRGKIDSSLALAVLRDVPYLVKASVWRLAYRQLYWPVPARYELHVAAEQCPRADNRISLASETDMFGLPLAAIDWRKTQQDFDVFAAYQRRFDNFWTRHGLQAIGDLRWSARPDATSLSDISRGGDIYHPAGTTRMGTDARSAVVDADLRTFAVANLWVASTSVFPTGPSANPTLMLMLLTMRLADRLQHELARGSD